DSEVSKKRMPRSYAWRTSLVNWSCPSSRCVRPLNVPVPNASRVTLTPDFPSVTQSVAVPRAARSGRLPVPASTPAASPVFKKLRLEQSAIRTSSNQPYPIMRDGPNAAPGMGARHRSGEDEGELGGGGPPSLG